MVHTNEVGQIDANEAAYAKPVKVTDGANVLGTDAHPLKVSGETLLPSVDELETKTDAVKTSVDAGNVSLTKLTDCDPQNIKACTVQTAAANQALLKAGGSYLITVEPADDDLATPTAVRWSTAEAAGATSPKWLSIWGPLVILPKTADLTLSMLRVGSADVTVQVMGLNAASTTALPA